MARLLLVFPEALPLPEIPVALSLLPHQVREVSGVEDALLEINDADLLVIDARSDLAWARTSCRLFSGNAPQHPQLLILDLQATSVITPEWGIDDFVLADAAPGELDARIRLLLMRKPSADTIVAGSVVIDEAAYTVSVGGHPLDLTYTEFELLKYLVTHPGRVLTRENLLSEVWGYDYYGGTRTVDVHIRRLRAKLGPEHDNCIGTVRNVGYRFQTA